MNHTVLYDALFAFGRDKQVDMMIEEMSELTKALLKHRRYHSEETYDNIQEEIVDVEIVLEQMKMLYLPEDKESRLLAYKMCRLEKLVRDKKAARNGLRAMESTDEE